MPYRYGEREQYQMFPMSIDEYVDKMDPVRAYDAFVDAINFKDIGIDLNEERVGNPEYDPRAMVKLLLYGYSYGERSSRKLERAMHHNLSFIWLMGGLTPDHKTIANFRRKHKKGLKQVLKMSVTMCLKLGLIEGNTLFVDGTKIRGNAGIKHTWDKKRCEKQMKEIDKRIEEILEICEKTDISEERDCSLVKMKSELQDKEALREEIKLILKELETTERSRINSTDKECVNYHSREGSHSGYNGQMVVDDKAGLIVSSDVVNENNDRGQFARQIEHAHENMGKKCQESVADAGYANTEELSKIDVQGIKVIVPSQRQAEGKKISAFDRTHFKYDKEQDTFLCPQGKILRYVSYNKKDRKRIYKIEKQRICQECSCFGTCTTFRKGRQITRIDKEEIKEKLKKQYLEKGSQVVYKRRKEKVEHPFGFIKRNLGFRYFLLRGLDGVKAEFALAASIFNIIRSINLVGGVENFIKKIAA